MTMRSKLLHDEYRKDNYHSMWHWLKALRFDMEYMPSLASVVLEALDECEERLLYQNEILKAPK